MISKASNLQNVITKLCRIAGVSRAGYYQWRKKIDPGPSDDEILLCELFTEKKGRYGNRRLKMLLSRRYKLRMNLKKIIRIKRDYGLITKIRLRNKARYYFKKGEEHLIAPNLLQRDFVPITKRTHFSLDVTELPYPGSKKAYLAATKDLATNEIVHFNVLRKPTVDLVVANLEEIFQKYTQEARTKMIIHTDQGFHFTSYAYRKKLERLGINQSMSRKGNCLDNAPIESFFGHLKDEVELQACKTFDEVRKMIEEYMKYYNYDRPQWCLKQKTPAEAGVELSLF